MAHALHGSHPHEFPSGWASFLEILILAPLAAVVVLGVVPSVFEIQWECVRGYGVVVRTAGDSYLTGFVVVATVGWLAVLAGMIFAHISERPRIALALPLAWFAVLVLASLVVGAAIGPATCGSRARVARMRESRVKPIRRRHAS